MKNGEKELYLDADVLGESLWHSTNSNLWCIDDEITDIRWWWNDEIHIIIRKNEVTQKSFEQMLVTWTNTKLLCHYVAWVFFEFYQIRLNAHRIVA